MDVGEPKQILRNGDTAPHSEEKLEASNPQHGDSDVEMKDENVYALIRVTKNAFRKIIMPNVMVRQSSIQRALSLAKVWGIST